MHLFPALDIDAHPSQGDLEEIHGLMLAALDDAGVSALHEREGGWRVFFSTAAARDAAAETLRSWNPDLPLSAVDVPDEDWARRSQEDLGPVRVGRVRISPPWAADRGIPGAPRLHQDPGGGGLQQDPRGVRLQPADLIDVIIQPSMGFGTGHHATTRLCVMLLQQANLVGQRVLDVGTGSGVLAIVASRLGAGVVVGIDDDGDALEAARENLALNGMGEAGAVPHIVLRRGDFRELAGAGYDVVTANLTGGLLIKGMDALFAALTPGGRLILSGITMEEEATVRVPFEARLPLITRVEEDGWVGLLLGEVPHDS